MKAHYILLEDSVILVPAEQFSNWREIQDAYPDYVASLGPWTKEELLSYLEDDFKEEADWPLTRSYIDQAYAT